MASLESINEHLRIASEQLDIAAQEIGELSFKPPNAPIRLIGEAVANILSIQHHIYQQRPDLDTARSDVPEPDSDLTPEQKTLVEDLSAEVVKTIDALLLSHAHHNWRKVARLVGSTMTELKNRPKGIPDVFYAQRVRKLVEGGRLEAVGDLRYMGRSEVRLPRAAE